MANEEGKKKLSEFRTSLGKAQGIGTLIGQARDVQLTDSMTAEARSHVAALGHEFYDSNTPIDEPGRFSEFDPGNVDQYNLAEDWAKRYTNVLNREASNNLKKNLGSMVKSLSNGQLEDMLTDGKGDTLKLVTDAAGKDYADWQKAYMQVAAHDGLTERAKSGKITADEKKLLEGRVINKRLKIVADRLKSKDIKDPLIVADTSSVIAKTVALEYASDKDAYYHTAATMLEEASANLAKYEKESGKSLNGFVSTAFGKLAQTPDGFKQVRNLMYKAASSEE